MLILYFYAHEILNQKPASRFCYQKTGTRTWHQFLVPVARFLVPAAKMADDTGAIAAVFAIALIVYYIITTNLNNLL